MKKDKKLDIQEESEDNYASIGMCLGSCFGVTIGAIVGLLTDNYILWMFIISISIPLGLAIGSAIKKDNNKK